MGADSPDTNAPKQCNAPGRFSGNPINNTTGNKFEVETDYVGAGAFPLNLVRYYNSQSTLAGEMGANWSHSYSANLKQTSATTVDIVRNDQKTLTFTLVNDQWTASASINSRLTQATVNGQTQWQYVTGDDNTETYDANGKLLSIAMRNGLTTTLAYDANGRLSTVSDPFGRQLTFAYDANNRVAQVTQPDGKTLTYSYDGNNNLVSVTYPDASSRQYLYENSSFPHALTGLIDENNSRYATWNYDANGRAVLSKHGTATDSTTVVYDMVNGQTKVTDGFGTERSYSYKTIFGIARTTEASQPCASCGGDTAHFEYDANGNIIRKQDYLGNVTTYVFDLARNLETSRTEAVGTAEERTITTEWHSTFRLPVKITEPTKFTTFVYDTHGNLTQYTVSADGQDQVWNLSYNASGQVTLIDGPRSDVNDSKTFTYDTKGNVTQISTPAIKGYAVSVTSYDANGRPLTIRDPNGLETKLSYDARGRLRTRNSGGEITTYAYDAAGQLSRITDPAGAFVTGSYDDAHRLVQLADDLGNRMVYSLDAMGNRTQEAIYDANGNLTQTRSANFDAFNRLAKVIGSQAQTTSFGYDDNGNVTSVTDPLGNKTINAYDPLNRLASVVDPAGGQIGYAYNTDDTVKQVIDPLSLTTEYNRDGFGQTAVLTSPDTGTTQNSYDIAGNVISSTDARGQTVTYSYDALNRLTQIVHPNKPPIVFTYDQGAGGIGHLTQMSDGTDTTAWSYDQHGRVIRKTQTSGSLTLITRYTYNANGQLTAMTYPSGQTVNLSYNGDGQIIALSNNGTQLLNNIQYQPFGSAQSWLFGNGETVRRDFDLDGRMTAYDLGGSRSRQLSYDANGRIQSYTDSNANHDQSFSYDSLDRLIGYTDPAKQIAYSYDANGNRTQQQSTADPIQNYLMDNNSNRLQSIVNANSQTIKAYSYDAAGHLTSDGYTSFSYDGRGRMVQASNVAMGTEQYRINGLGQRIAKLTGTPPDLSGDANGDGTITAADLRLIALMTRGSLPVDLAADCNHDGKITNADAACAQAKLADMKLNPSKYVQAGTYFIYDEAGHLLGEYNQNGTAIQETVWLGNMPVAVLKGGKAYYVYADHLDTPRAISDSTGSVVWRWDSDAFGTTKADEDPDKNGIAFTYNLRFPGQYYDKGTGLHYNYFRDYMPGIGRYIESDPIGLEGGYNTYIYVTGNPISITDIRGTDIQIRGQIIRSPYGKEYTDYTISFYSPSLFNKIANFCTGTKATPVNIAAGIAKDYVADKISAYLLGENLIVKTENEDKLKDLFIGSFSLGNNFNPNYYPIKENQLRSFLSDAVKQSLIEPIDIDATIKEIDKNAGKGGSILYGGF